MSDLTLELQQQVGKPEGQQLEYKAILIPARNMAMIIASMANASGGYLIFGVKEAPHEAIDVKGLSNDFRVTAMIHKAMDMLFPQPTVAHQYFTHQDKTLYGIKIDQSAAPILLAGVRYVRSGDQITEPDRQAPPTATTAPVPPRIEATSKALLAAKKGSTGAKGKYLDHYLSILSLYTQGSANLYPVDFNTATTVAAGKVLGRILFGSCVDTFETYLSDLLYEIYTAVPNALKSNAPVTVEEVMDCADMDEFIKWYATKRIKSLQKGSVKGFLEDNKELSQLNAFSKKEIKEIEAILQIRHLYTHRNGIVDEPFLAHFRGQYALGSEHLMTMKETFDILDVLIAAVIKIDAAAASKYNLSTNEP